MTFLRKPDAENMVSLTKEKFFNDLTNLNEKDVQYEIINAVSKQIREQEDALINELMDKEKDAKGTQGCVT